MSRTCGLKGAFSPLEGLKGAFSPPDGDPPALVAVAHGSRDPRSAATAAELMELVRSLRPDLDVRLAFLDLSAPRLGDVLTAVHRCEHGRGHGAGDGCGYGHGGSVTVVPLLLGHAYHATVDVPGAVRAAVARMPRLQVRIADVLGPSPRLSSVALRRLAEAGVALDDPGLGVVVAAAGSSHRPANAAVEAVAADWSRRAPWVGAHAAFAAATGPSVPDAIAALRANGARRIAVASWFLAPGLLPDRVASTTRTTDPTVPVAAPLGADIELAHLILERYHTATARTAPLRHTPAYAAF